MHFILRFVSSVFNIVLICMVPLCNKTLFSSCPLRELCAEMLPFFHHTYSSIFLGDTMADVSKNNEFGPCEWKGLTFFLLFL